MEIAYKIQGCALATAGGQVKHKHNVPPSEGCQTPSEGFRLQVKNKRFLLRDSILVILRF